MIGLFSDPQEPPCPKSHSIGKSFVNQDKDQKGNMRQRGEDKISHIKECVLCCRWHRECRVGRRRLVHQNHALTKMQIDNEHEQPTAQKFEGCQGNQCGWIYGTQIKLSWPASALCLLTSYALEKKIHFSKQKRFNG